MSGRFRRGEAYGGLKLVQSQGKFGDAPLAETELFQAMGCRVA